MVYMVYSTDDLLSRMRAAAEAAKTLTRDEAHVRLTEQGFLDADGRLSVAYGSEERVAIPVSGTDADLTAAIDAFYSALPGWWFTVGRCSVSCHASVGPDGNWVANPLLDQFDGGFHQDLALPSSMAEALRSATAEAVSSLHGTGYTSTGRQK